MATANTHKLAGMIPAFKTSSDLTNSKLSFTSYYKPLCLKTSTTFFNGSSSLTNDDGFKSKTCHNAGIPCIPVTDTHAPVVIVTGSSITIVKAVAVRLASSGCKVLVNVFGSSEKGYEISSKINNMGHEALSFTGDILTLSDAASMVREALQAWGTIDILVNVAGMTPETTFFVETMPLLQWQEVIEKNLTSFYRCIEATSSVMTRQRKGRIITVSDMSVIGLPGQTSYGASAAGVIGLTRSAANEKSKAKIAVNVVTPYGVGTDVSDQSLEAIPLGNYDKLDKIVDMVEYLAFDVLGGAFTGLVFSLDEE